MLPVHPFNQVFLGMAASFVPPKRDIVALIEDVEAAGVRFVYFSPRNMRRSKVRTRDKKLVLRTWHLAIFWETAQSTQQEARERSQPRGALERKRSDGRCGVLSYALGILKPSNSRPGGEFYCGGATRRAKYVVGRTKSWFSRCTLHSASPKQLAF